MRMFSYLRSKIERRSVKGDVGKPSTKEMPVNPDLFIRDEFNDVITGFSTKDEIDQLPPWEVARALILSIYYVYEASVEGDIVEFGTMSGFTASRMAKAMSVLEKKVVRSAGKSLLLFDSFEGLPTATAEADATSIHVSAGVWGPGGCFVLSEPELLERCALEFDRDRIKTFPGWFSNTLPKVPDNTKLALIHVDCDLYQSTLDALDPCFTRGLVSEGAAICFDDWNPNRAKLESGERRAWAELVDKFEIIFSDWGPYSWGGQKFIVHKYNGMRGN